MKVRIIIEVEDGVITVKQESGKESVSVEIPVKQEKTKKIPKPKVASEKICIICGEPFIPNSNRQMKCKNCKVAKKLGWEVIPKAPLNMDGLTQPVVLTENDIPDENKERLAELKKKRSGFLSKIFD